MKLFLLALLALASTSASAAGANEIDAAISRWESDMESRAARAESRCLYSPALAARSCAELNGPPSHSPDFRFDPDAAFDKAEAYYEAAQLWKDGRRMGKLLSSSAGWSAVFSNFWLAMTDPAEWERQGKNTSGAKIKAAMERAQLRYENLRAKAAYKGKGLSEEGRIALAACVSANTLQYNAAEADAVKGGRSDPLDVARLPWQSFATNMAEEQTGRGVCRDYAAIARDFLRAMGTRARVVGSTGHAMTEVTLSRGGRDEVYLFEPQHDLLVRDCVLYRYAR